MRKAASMLELIVAIVIMGMAVMTLPMMLEQTQKNNEFAFQQEVLLAAKTKLGDTLTYRWDENSLNNERIVVLETNGDSELTSSIDNRRVGHIYGDKRRKFNLENNATATANFNDGNIDDLDDFDGESVGLFGVVAELDYRFIDFNMTTTVTYVSDTADYNSTNLSFNLDTATAGGTTSIKMLTLRIADAAENIEPFTLRAYSCNIGESEFLRRYY